MCCLGSPDFVELGQVHLARGPAASDAFLFGVERGKILAESFSAGGLHFLFEFRDAAFDFIQLFLPGFLSRIGLFFLTLFLRLLRLGFFENGSFFAIGFVAAALGQVVEGAAEFEGFEFLSKSQCAQAIGEDMFGMAALGRAFIESGQVVLPEGGIEFRQDHGGLARREQPGLDEEIEEFSPPTHPAVGEAPRLASLAARGIAGVLFAGGEVACVNSGIEDPRSATDEFGGLAFGHAEHGPTDGTCADVEAQDELAGSFESGRHGRDSP